MEFKNGDRVINKKTHRRGMFTEHAWETKDLSWVLWDGEKEERKEYTHHLELDEK